MAIKDVEYIKGVAVNKYYVLILSCIIAHAMNGMNEQKTNDWDANKYQKHSDLQYKAAMYALSKISFKGNESVLDIGSGDGRITAEIAKRVPQGSVLGIDISPNMIEHARNNHQQDNVSFELYDISKGKNFYDLQKQLKESHSFHVITAFSSLSWIKNQSQAFNNIFYLLKAKGQFRAGIAHEDSPYLRARYKMLTHDKWKDFFVDYEMPYYPSNEQTVQKLLEHAWLKPVEITKTGVPQLFATRQDFIDWMSAIPAQIDRIPLERQQEFLDDIVTEYLQEVPEKENGSIEVIIGALGIHACPQLPW